MTFRLFPQHSPKLAPAAIGLTLVVMGLFCGLGYLTFHHVLGAGIPQAIMASLTISGVSAGLFWTCYNIGYKQYNDDRVMYCVFGSGKALFALTCALSSFFAAGLVFWLSVAICTAGGAMLGWLAVESGGNDAAHDRGETPEAIYLKA